jgi:hypothetical protein
VFRLGRSGLFLGLTGGGGLDFGIMLGLVTRLLLLLVATFLVSGLRLLESVQKIDRRDLARRFVWYMI